MYLLSGEKFTLRVLTSFNQLKKLISKPPVLKIFDNDELLIQTDASKDGVGAVLLSKGQPIAFASAALSPNKQNWAQIEKEMYAIDFACEKFHYYIYGRHVKVNSDHEPLESIFKKGINQISVRLQKMRLRLLKYDITVEYLKGSKMYIADYLSRSYIKQAEKESNDFVVHTLKREISISKQKWEEIKKETEKDENLKEVLKHCKFGWPECKKKLSIYSHKTFLENKT